MRQLNTPQANALAAPMSAPMSAPMPKANLYRQASFLVIESLAPHDLDDLKIIETPQSAMIQGGIATGNPETLPETTPAAPQAAPQAGLNESSHWSTSLQNLLDQPPSTLPLRLFFGGLVFSAAFGTWAWLGQVQEVSTAQGRLIPQGEVYQVQPVVPGELTNLWVEEGQTVRAGEVIAELDSRLAEAEVERLQASLAAYRLQLTQTQGLIDRSRLEIETRRAIAAADTQAQAAAIAQASSNASTHRDVLSQLQKDVTAYTARLDRLRPLVEEGALAEDRMFEVEQALRDRQQIMTQRSGELQQTLAEADRLQAGLEQKQAEGERSQLEAQQRLQQLEMEVTQLQAKIAETENLIKSAQTQKEQKFLHAPADGTISFLQVRRQGQMVQPGQTVAEIAPQDAPLVLSATLPTREAGFVKVGMPVNLKFDAFPYQDFGVVSGEVIAVSPDVILDERMGAVYRLEIALDLSTIHQRHPNLNFKAGQTATAEIVVRQRRIIDVILEPIRQLQTGGINL